MPIFEYRCENEHITEVIILNSGKEPEEQVECRECSEPAQLTLSLPSHPWSGKYGSLRYAPDPEVVAKSLMPKKVNK